MAVPRPGTPGIPGTPGTTDPQPMSGPPRARGSAPRPTGLLVDLDNVLRRWDPAVHQAIEARHGLSPGTLGEAVMSWDHLLPAITGEISHAEWMDRVAREVRQHFAARPDADADADAGADTDADADAGAAVREYFAYRGEVDQDVLALVRRVRAAGRPVGLATNSTDLLDQDLADLDVSDEFDAVVNSSRLGVVKPQPEFYQRACAALGLPTAEVILLDDSVRFVAGARAAGLYAHRYAGPADLAYLVNALGIA